jgi:hypothetical protein
MRKRIKVTGFSDWDSMFYNNLLCIPVLFVSSIIVEDWGTENLARNLYVRHARFQGVHILMFARFQPSRDPKFPVDGDSLLWCRCCGHIIYNRLVYSCDKQHNIQVRFPASLPTPS